MSRTLRVLQLVSRDEPGGVQVLTRTIEAGLGEHAEVTTIALRGRLRHAIALVRMLVFGRYDAILTYHAAASVLGCALAWLGRVPLRAAHQTAMPHAVRAHWRLLDKLCGKVGIYTHIIANSTATRHAFRPYPAAYRNRLSLIPHGVEPLPPPSGLCNWRTALSIPPRAPLLVATGRLAPQKSHITAIAALARLPDAYLVIAGDGPDRPMLLQTALRLGVAGRVHLVGNLDRTTLADLLAAADIYLFPSVWETFGLAGVEGGMAGLPIIAADLPVLREVLAPGRDRGTVHFHPPGDAGALAAAITAMLAGYPSPERRASAASAFVDRHGTATMIDRYRALLGSI